MQVIKRDGRKEALDVSKIQKETAWACQGLNVSQSELEMRAQVLFFDGMKTTEIHAAVTRGAVSMISKECMDASKAAARLVVLDLYKRVAGSMEYPSLRSYIERGVEMKLLNPELLTKFSLTTLDQVINPARDRQFEYLGIQTLQDRYLIRAIENRKSGEVIELPQHFFMRVAMGLALREDNPTARAAEFYNLLSSFDFMSSTPTLFNAGTLHSQLSSCYLNTMADTISADVGANPYASIFGTIEECARLSKYAGGIGTDVTRVRSAGDLIVGTSGKSSGVVPYLKIYNDTAVAVNQGGKRPGSFAPYMEPWHPDLWDFCDLKKNSGDERRRTHDIYPATWIPDLLMKRVKEKGVWSFFSPAEHPELHELYGDAFEKRYAQLEAHGTFRFQKPAMEVWKKILTSLFETGHPWITFKDTCNLRNPQDHVGVVHNSNLCTEITLNTSDDETAVCNLGSVNMARHMMLVDGKYVPDYAKLKRTVTTAMRMLDNVIDINFYPSDRAKVSNLRHRPVGMGAMGYTEFLVAQGIDWESEAHLDMADEFFERLSFYAIEASSDLAVERGAYPSFEGSKWSKGILPIDTANPAAGGKATMNWSWLRAKVQADGMRNSNTMAIAPTATISNIIGTTPCIEPVFERETVKSNLSGQFKWVDPSLRYGRPELCKEAFEVDQLWLIRAAARRQKWLDQAQSLNIFAKRGIRGKDLALIYMTAWELGLKTTYYLRTQSVTADEIAKAAAPVAKPAAEASLEAPVGMCSIDNPECEACQ